MNLRSAIAAFVMLMLVTAPAGAQRRAAPPPLTPTDWAHGSTVSLEGGVASVSSDVGAVLGGAIGWSMTPKLMVEGSARWVDSPGAANGFNAALKLRTGMRRAGVSPFAEGGFGLYHLNPTSSADADLPEFYRRRLTNGGTGTGRSFTDPAFHVGGGLSLFVSRKLAFQPAADLMIVTGDGESYVAKMFVLRATYHFENHPVTPVRRTAR
jgi:hypothetical protein